MKLAGYSEIVFYSEIENVCEKSETIIQRPHNYDSKACSVVAFKFSIAVLNICYNHPHAVINTTNTHPLTKMSTRRSFWGKVRPTRKAYILTPHVNRLSRDVGSSTSHNLTGPHGQ
jgi:hypothetical protein